MQTPAPYVLCRGDPAPVQQSGTTCGAASLAVARMLADPAFAASLRPAETGELDLARFAAYEQVVLRRTNSLRPAGGRLNPPWPRALGTSPLGALRELETTVTAGARYRIDVLRWRGGADLRSSYAALSAVTRSGWPVLLYVGNALLPRHVVLVLPPSDSGQVAGRATAQVAGRSAAQVAGHAPAQGSPAEAVLDVYDPATGLVVPLDEDAFASRRLRLAGWDILWLVLAPRSAG